MKRRRVGYRQRQQELNAQTPQAYEFPLQVLKRVVFKDRMGLQEIVNLVTGFKAEQTPQIRLMEMTLPVFFGDQGLQRAARQIAVLDGAELGGNVVGNLNRHLHASVKGPREGKQ